MANPLNSPASGSLGLLLARLPLGVYFAWAGVNKIAGGVAKFVDKQSGQVPDWMPEQLGQAYLYALPFAEVLVGAIVVGLLGRIAGLLAALMLVSFMIAATGLKSGGGAPFHYNLVFLGTALMLLFTGPGAYSVDARLGRRAAVPAKKKPE
jgi:uncharacterized membrane protein YphA (DoxX/SURF4 family)